MEQRETQSRVAQALKSNRIVVGTSIQMNSTEVAELAGKCGFDFVVIDMEHGSFGIDSCVNLIRAVEAGGADPIVRVPDDSRVGIGRVLDAGAYGVVVPNVSSGQQAREIMAATRFAPEGLRGACPYSRAADYGLTSWDEHTQWARRNVMTNFIIESNRGVADIDSILDAGPDSVAVGLFDLSVDMGLNGDMQDPSVKRAYQNVAAATLDRGIDFMNPIFGIGPEETRARAEEATSNGSRMVMISGDRWLLGAGFRAMIDSLEGLGDTAEVVGSLADAGQVTN